MARVFVSMGSNIDKQRNVVKALQLLRAQHGELTCSTLYECAALGFVGDDFYNMVVAFDTGKEPREINESLRQIEDQLERVRGKDRFVSRTMDLDVLLYDDWVIDDGVLSIPREEILLHEFVLCPLAEICGNLKHPVHNTPIANLWHDWNRKHPSNLREVSLPSTEAEVSAAINGYHFTG